MIAASSTFLPANAELAKFPIYRIEIEGYWRTFVHIPSDVNGLMQAPGINEFPIYVAL